MELLAPAGNRKCLEAAVMGGADAVYLAGINFGARSFADNFEISEIEDAVRYCHLRGVRVYVTVNTLILDREISVLEEYIVFLARANVDAVIVQDLGVMEIIHRICPKLPVHISTQATIHNLNGVLEMERLGAKRVVLSRELSYDEIKYISENSSAELEVFVHGAMCMCYSGQCLMSSVLGGRSGNRGKCAQPCRLPYMGSDGYKSYLSLKDMCLLGHLKELCDMGIVSLKVEGRMKGPDYISAVIGTYRRCIDEKRKPTDAEMADVNRVFFRGGLTDGYFKNQKGINMFAFDKPDNPYEKNEALSTYTKEHKRTVFAKLKFNAGDKPSAELVCDGKKITCFGDGELQVATNRCLREEDVINQFSKSGGTPFEIVIKDINIEGEPFCSVKDINALRRRGLSLLEEKLLSDNYEIYPFKRERCQSLKTSDVRYTASVLNREQFEVIKEFPFEYIYVPIHIIAENPKAFLNDKGRIVLMPPAILKDSEYKAYEDDLQSLYNMGFRSLSVQNMSELSRLDFKLFGGMRLNITNSISLNKLKNLEMVSLSAELNSAQMRDMEKTVPTEVMAYGRLALMVTENCILKNIGSCPCGDYGVLTDRKGSKFYIVRDGKNCRSVLLNSVPLYMADRTDELKKTGAAFLRLDFTTEENKECINVCKAYINGESLNINEYTRLHKGVL